MSFRSCSFCDSLVGGGSRECLACDILVFVTSLGVKHCLLDVERLKIYLTKERKETVLQCLRNFRQVVDRRWLLCSGCYLRLYSFGV